MMACFLTCQRNAILKREEGAGRRRSHPHNWGITMERNFSLTGNNANEYMFTLMPVKTGSSKQEVKMRAAC